MEKPEPMADLVCRSSAQVEGCGSASWDGLGEDIASVLVEGGAAWRGSSRKVADAEEAAAKVGKEVYIKVGVGAFPEGGLHLAVIVASSPLVVDGEVGTNERK